MARCREDRHRRRASGNHWTTSEAIMRTGQYKCKTVACFACRRDHVGRNVAKAKDLFSMGDTDNAECSLVTINWGKPCHNLDEVAAAHRKFSDDMRNWRHALVKKHRSFARGTMHAILEVQYAGGMWRPHWHIMVHHPRVDRSELCYQLRHQWDGSRQVQVEAYWATQSAVENTARCGGYAFKFKTWEWPTSSAAQLFCWIRMRAALRSMIVIIRPTLARKRRVPSHQGQCHKLAPATTSGGFDDPMPMAFGSSFTTEHGHPINWSPQTLEPPPSSDHYGGLSNRVGFSIFDRESRLAHDQAMEPPLPRRGQFSSPIPFDDYTSRLDNAYHNDAHREDREWGGSDQVGWPRTR